MSLRPVQATVINSCKVLYCHVKSYIRYVERLQTQPDNTRIVMDPILSSTVAAIIAATALGVAAQSPPPASPTLVGSAVAPRALAVARSTALTTIQGNTLTSTNGV